MTRRWIHLLVATSVGLVTLSAATPAGASLRIVKIYYDSPGSDTGSNSSLNHEFVTMKNDGNKAVAMTGCTLRDTAGHVFRFPRFKLQPGSSVSVHTGKGTNARHDLYWRSGWYIWNNDGDTATLRRRDGSTASRCSYAGGGAYKIC